MLVAPIVSFSGSKAIPTVFTSSQTPLISPSRGRQYEVGYARWLSGMQTGAGERTKHPHGPAEGDVMGQV